MEIFLVWLVFAVLVGVAASARGRSGLGWFILSVILSPLLGLLFVLVLPNLRHEDLLRTLAGPQGRRAGLGGKSSTVTIDRVAAGAFNPDGVYAGVPYAVQANGRIAAMMPGGLVNFRSVEQFRAAVDGDTVVDDVDLASTAERFPNEANGWRYRVEKNGKVHAWTAATGERSYRTWREFFDTTQR
ncbi:hypothetical protein SAMN05216374_0947 [Tardiphaga sp. OK246]|uniref:hypothetical protein n=1 Tax=Tardiphaga sp. OK246 TaxID=1855307 RepID=UPI000B69FA1E|nr:hypothetical protein [Tardiphaga sp. OK246]SNS35406.1 hypothetical protein SAMN05216374_0947 [Tardiphaga sp. OK246]